MKVTGVKIVQTQTFNLGEYNSVRLGTEVNLELEDDETAEDAIDYGTEIVRAALRERIKPFVKYIVMPPADAPAVHVERLFQGKPVLSDAE